MPSGGHSGYCDCRWIQFHRSQAITAVDGNLSKGVEGRRTGWMMDGNRLKMLTLLFDVAAPWLNRGSGKRQGYRFQLKAAVSDCGSKQGESVGFPLVLLQCSFPSRQPQGQFAHAVCRHHQEGDEQHPRSSAKSARRAEKAAAVVDQQELDHRHHGHNQQEGGVFVEMGASS